MDFQRAQRLIHRARLACNAAWRKAETANECAALHRALEDLSNAAYFCRLKMATHVETAMWLALQRVEMARAIATASRGLHLVAA